MSLSDKENVLIAEGPPNEPSSRGYILQCLGPLGLLLVALISLAPFFLDPDLTKAARPRESPWVWISMGGILLAMLLAVGLRAWTDRARELRPFVLNLFFAVLACGLTACHYVEVDSASQEVKQGRRVLKSPYINWQ